VRAWTHGPDTEAKMSIYRSELAAAVRDRDMCSLGAVPANLMGAATSPGLGTRRFGSPLTDDADLRQMSPIPDSVATVAVTPSG